jgi:hypothetical protein
MNKQIPLRIGQAAAHTTNEDLQAAAEHAMHLMQNSSVIRVAWVAMIASRQLYILSRETLESEIVHGWECENPLLIAQMLVQSAQEKATENFDPDVLLGQMLTTVVPYLHHIASLRDAQPQPEQSTGNESTKSEPVAEPETEPEPVAEPEPPADTSSAD